MHALWSKLYQPSPSRSLSVTFAILLAVVVQHVVFAGNVENLLGADALERLIERVEFRRFR